MNEWPSGWFRDEKPKPAGGADGSGTARPEAAGEPTVRLPAGSAGAAPAGGYARAAGGRGQRAGAWPEQPPLHGTPGGQRVPAPATRPRRVPVPQPGGRGGGRTGRHRGRRILLITGSVVLVVLVLLGAMYFYLDSRLARNNALVDYANRPAAGAGTNWLITGSDSRAGLTRAQKRQLHTGSDAGSRSDTILILHIPSNGGRAVLISLPRDRVEQESARMGVLVEDMLLLARLDQQRPIERLRVDTLTLAADAVQDARMIAPGRTIDLTVGSGTAFLVGDEARLRQVITNLMSNALSHTPDGTPIDVRLLAHGPDGRLPAPSVTLEVDDHGPGLSKEQADRVFERFYRADQARGRKTGGAGLGLAIVAALVTAHGGAVGVDTAPGSGAMFWITLPLAAEAV